MTKKSDSELESSRAIRVRGLGPLEMEVLDILWGIGAGTSRDIYDQVLRRRRLGQSTVLTVLRRLVARGVVNRDLRGSLYYYTASIERRELGCLLISEVVELIYGGSAERAIEHLNSRRRLPSG